MFPQKPGPSQENFPAQGKRPSHGRRTKPGEWLQGRRVRRAEGGPGRGPTLSPLFSSLYDRGHLKQEVPLHLKAWRVPAAGDTSLTPTPPLPQPVSPVSEQHAPGLCLGSWKRGWGTWARGVWATARQLPRHSRGSEEATTVPSHDSGIRIGND